MNKLRSWILEKLINFWLIVSPSLLTYFSQDYNLLFVWVLYKSSGSYCLISTSTKHIWKIFPWKYCYENAINATSFNTRQHIHTNKYIELVPSKPTTNSMIEKRIFKCANTQTKICTQYTGNNVYIVHKKP